MHCGNIRGIGQLLWASIFPAIKTFVDTLMLRNPNTATGLTHFRRFPHINSIKFTAGNSKVIFAQRLHVMHTRTSLISKELTPRR